MAEKNFNLHWICVLTTTLEAPFFFREGFWEDLGSSEAVLSKQSETQIGEQIQRNENSVREIEDIISRFATLLSSGGPTLRQFQVLAERFKSLFHLETIEEKSKRLPFKDMICRNQNLTGYIVDDMIKTHGGSSFPNLGDLSNGITIVTMVQAFGRLNGVDFIEEISAVNRILQNVPALRGYKIKAFETYRVTGAPYW